MGKSIEKSAENNLTIFKNRSEAGQLLAEKLKTIESENPYVLALPRGGIPVAIEVAKALHAPLEIIGVKKVGAPLNPELGIAAVVEDGTSILNQTALNVLGLSESQIHESIRRKREEARSNGILFRRGRRLPSFEGRTVIVVDDGLATGVTALAVAKFLKSQKASKIIFGVPVCAPDSAMEILSEFDSVICVSRPYYFRAVGTSYGNFLQLSDEDVVSMLRDYERQTVQKNEEISIQCGSVTLKAIYHLPRNAKATVIFAHGSGSGRLSPRNQLVAKKLFQAGFGTLLADLLTDEESKIRENVFDIPLLTSRLVSLSEWVKQQDRFPHSIAFFGASTGAAAALDAAAQVPDIFAIVSRGGRPDLASRLKRVTAPTLLIVGGDDDDVLELNRLALKEIRHGSLEVIPGATHLFEEPGALDKVTELAKKWFLKKLENRMKGSAAYAV